MSKRLVVLGGGVAGIEVLRTLKGTSKIEKVLIDPSDSHLWKPELHKIAANTSSEEENTASFKKLSKKFGFKHVKERISKVDRKTKSLTLSSGETMTYDWIVVSVGSQPNDFGIPGVSTNCLFLDNVADALHVQTVVFDALKTATIEKPLKVSVIGGGATGTQLCAEISATAAKKLKISVSKRSQLFQMSLIEATPDILGSFPATVRAQAKQNLIKHGVNVLTNDPVKEVLKGKINLQSGQVINADIIIWAAGVKAGEATKLFDIARTRGEQIIVNQHLQSIDDEHIFAAGDCASVQEQLLFPTAQVARQEGAYLASSVFSKLADDAEVTKDFKYRSLGAVVTLGTYNAWGQWPSGTPFGGDWVTSKLAYLIHYSLVKREQLELKGSFYTLKATIQEKIKHIFS